MTAGGQPSTGTAPIDSSRPALDSGEAVGQSHAVMSLRGDLLACLCCAILVVALVAERQARSGDVSARSMLTVRRPFTLVGVQSNKCVGASQGDLTNAGATLEIATCDGSPRQQFSLEPRSERSYRVRNVGNGMCIDVQGGSTNNGAPVIQFPCNEGRNQRWAFTRISPQTYELSAVHSNHLLDVTGASDRNGAPLQQWDLNDSGNQRFRLVH